MFSRWGQFTCADGVGPCVSVGWMVEESGGALWTAACGGPNCAEDIGHALDVSSSLPSLHRPVLTCGAVKPGCLPCRLLQSKMQYSKAKMVVTCTVSRPLHCIDIKYTARCASHIHRQRPLGKCQQKCRLIRMQEPVVSSRDRPRRRQ